MLEPSGIRSEEPKSCLRSLSRISPSGPGAPSKPAIDVNTLLATLSVSQTAKNEPGPLARCPAAFLDSSRPSAHAKGHPDPRGGIGAACDGRCSSPPQLG